MPVDVIVSSDGINWRAPVVPWDPNTEPPFVSAGNGQFVIFRNEGLFPTFTPFGVSNDGAVFVESDPPPFGAFSRAIFGSGTWLTTTAGGLEMVSADAISWGITNPPFGNFAWGSFLSTEGDVRDLCLSGGVIIGCGLQTVGPAHTVTSMAVGADGTPDGSTTGDLLDEFINSDGTNMVRSSGQSSDAAQGTIAYGTVGSWTHVTLITAPLYRPAFGNGLWVIGSDSTAPHVIWTSPDGLTWTPRPSPFDGGGACQALAYSSTLGLWVAVGRVDRAGGHILATSPDGITWTPRRTPMDNGVASDVVWSSDLGLFCVTGLGLGAAGWHLGHVATAPEAGWHLGVTT